MHSDELRQPRYAVVLDPADNYSIFDDWMGVPAEVEGCVLIGLTLDDASYLCRELNEAQDQASASGFEIAA
ncbi:MAG TPA: hypothetical protein VGN97_22945 [Mesorhizobium sp.]|jgi:hypothetical protein|nr:hypothetical protein [Mesorhizobium sp.]